ncbi:MAG: hypothetical protein ACYDA8_14810 [Deferrisomatales bacterium]
MAAQTGRETVRAVDAYLQRLDFGRNIHRKLDDGALLALCEDYGDDEEPPPPR